MASFGSGFASGTYAGTSMANSWINAYRGSVEAARLEELRGRQDVEYKRQQEDIKVREGMNQAGATAAERGYDKNGFATVNPAYEGGPGDTEGAVTKAPVMEDGRRREDKVLDGMKASEDFALKNKRFDLMLQAHIKSETVAAPYREQRAAEAVQLFDLTGDPMTLVGFANRFVRDGTSFDKPTVNDDGTITVTGKLSSGATFKKENLKPEEVKSLFLNYARPEVAQARALQRAQDLQKMQIDIEVKKAGLPAQSFKPGDMVRDPVSGKMVQAGGVDYKTINGGEGEGQRLIAISYGNGGQVISEVDVSRHFDNTKGFSKAENARADDVAKGINSALDLEKSQGFGMPELSAASIKANSVASDLIAANRSNPNNIEAGKLVDYAMRIARGDKTTEVKPVDVTFQGIVYGKADAIIIDGKPVMTNGKPVYTNPQQVREIEGKILADKREAAAPRMAPDRPTNVMGQPVPGNRTPTNLTTDPAIDKSRRQVLEPELATETAKLAELQAMDEASYRAKYGTNAEPREAAIARANTNLAALQREVQALGPAADQPVSDGMSVNGRRVQGPPPIPPAAVSPSAAPGATPAAIPMSAAPARTGAMPAPVMSGAVVPAEERNAQMANLAEQSSRAQAVLNSRGATPARMSEARAALRDVRDKRKELSSTFTPEAVRLQEVILNPMSSRAEVADARATLRARREQSSTTSTLPMSQ